MIQTNKGNSTKGIAFFVFILSIKGPPINKPKIENNPKYISVSYTHLRAHETQ